MPGPWRAKSAAKPFVISGKGKAKMSKIGKMPVNIPSGVKVELKDGVMHIKGPKGELTFKPHALMNVAIESDKITVTRPDDDRFSRSLHGLTRALFQNMIVGVTAGYSRTLELVGVGYRAEMKGKLLNLQVGYSHPILFRPPEGVTVVVQEKEGKITVSGIDKQLVGAMAAKIRSMRPPEPYKGKGIKYAGEIILRKAGKAAGAA